MPVLASAWRSRGSNAKVLGVLAVVDLVVAFSFEFDARRARRVPHPRRGHEGHSVSRCSASQNAARTASAPQALGSMTLQYQSP